MRDAIVTWPSVQTSDKAVPNFPFAHSIHFINKCTSSFLDFKSTLGQISSLHVKALIPVIILSLVILDIECIYWVIYIRQEILKQSPKILYNSIGLKAFFKISFFKC